MPRGLVTVLKLAFVAGLMVLVFWNIPWRDRLVVHRGDQVVEELPGTIIGPWNVDPVRFRPEGSDVVRDVVRGPADGGEVDVQPGFLTYWRNLDPWLFALGAFCYFCTVLIAGTRWWWLLRVSGLGVSLAQTWRFTWIGIFFNNVVPGQTGGDLVKALYIMKRCPGQRVPALVSVIVDRVLGLASLAILGAIVVLFEFDRFREIAYGIWGVMAFVGLLGIVAFSRRIRRAVRLKELLEKLPGRVSGVLKLVDQAVFHYRSHKLVIGVSLIAGVGNHVVSILSVVFIGEALGVGMPRMEYFVLVPVINIVSAVPIGPNGWGVGEALYKYLFQTYGAEYAASLPNPAQAMGIRGVALSVLYRLHLTFWSLLGGLLMLFEKDRVTREDVRHEVELEQRESVEP